MIGGIFANPQSRNFRASGGSLLKRRLYRKCETTKCEMKTAPTGDILSFGYWVQERRLALDLTRPALARRVHCSPSTIKKIERDERRPSRQIAELLADQLLIPEHERDRFVAMARG